MPQDLVATLCGFKDQSYISKIERGVRRVSLQEAIDIAQVLGVSLDSLLYEQWERKKTVDSGCRNKR